MKVMFIPYINSEYLVPNLGKSTGPFDNLYKH